VQATSPQCGNRLALSTFLAGTQPAQRWSKWTFDPPADLPVVGYRIECRWHVNGSGTPTGWFYDYSVAEWNQAGQPTAAESCTPHQCPESGPARWAAPASRCARP
jgi:hypothetical protein